MNEVKLETAIPQQLETKTVEDQLRDLSELQLALVGGGIGDTII